MKQPLLFAGAAALLVSLVFAVPSLPNGRHLDMPSDLTAASVELIETDTVSAPHAYRTLCEQAPHICAAQQAAPTLEPLEAAMRARFGADALRPTAVVWTPERARQLEQVNAVVNSSIEPRIDLYGDVWSLGAMVGDCEEYVLAKREMLLRLGWPRSSLRITIVHDGIGYHAVLVASTEAGDFVLDNLVGHVSRLEDSRYAFIVAESLETPGDWVRVSIERR